MQFWLISSFFWCSILASRSVTQKAAGALEMNRFILHLPPPKAEPQTWWTHLWIFQRFWNSLWKIAAASNSKPKTVKWQVWRPQAFFPGWIRVGRWWLTPNRADERTERVKWNENHRFTRQIYLAEAPDRMQGIWAAFCSIVWTSWNDLNVRLMDLRRTSEKIL